jgi:uncharacterized protein (DUF2062 family)
MRKHLRALIARGKLLLQQAHSERASPREIAIAVALGAFAGCSPAIGAHGWLAVGLATILRKNRLFAFFGSRVSFFLTLPWIVLLEIQLSHRLRTGAWAELSAETALAQAHLLLLDWCLGWIPVGLFFAALTAPLGYAWGKRRERRAAAAPPPAP